MPGSRPTSIKELVRAQDRISYIYLERCVIHRDSNAITATDDQGTTHLPAASLGVLLLGPGTRVSHQAISLLAESGSTAVWVGEHGVRYYAHGRPLTHSSKLLEAQAVLVTNRDSRLRVAREMYAMRFPGEDSNKLSMQQLRGREGARVKRCYRSHSQRTGVTWDRRNYDIEDFVSGTPINKTLSIANTCLYGLAHTGIVALGCSPGLGFIHTGHERSFVYDVADLYKAETSIPVAFDIAASVTDDIEGSTRRRMRDVIHEMSLLKRIVSDIKDLLSGANDTSSTDASLEETSLNLWDGKNGVVPGGISYDTSEDVNYTSEL